MGKRRMRERYEYRGNGRIWDRINACYMMNLGRPSDVNVMNMMDQANIEKHGIPRLGSKEFKFEEIRSEMSWTEKLKRVFEADIP